MKCPHCYKKIADTVKDLPRNFLEGNTFRCPHCGKFVSLFHLFRDILSKAGMNESEDFYKTSSGSNAFEGMILWIIENKASLCKAIWKRAKYFYVEFKEETFTKLALSITARQIEKGSDLNPDLMNTAIVNSFFEAVKVLHVNGHNFIESKKNCYKASSLSLAAQCESVDVVNYIIDSGVNYKKDRDCLFDDFDRNNLDILTALLEAGVPSENRHIIIACSWGNFEMVRLLFEYCVEIGKWELYVPFLLQKFNFKRISKDNEDKLIEIVNYFLKVGVDINYESVNGWVKNDTVLYKLCSREKNLPIIKILIGFGAKIISGTKKSALINACLNGCPNIVRFLLRNGADPLICDKYGANCYLNAICSGNLDAVKITLALCDKNIVDNYGRGPFQYVLQTKSSQDASDIFDYLTTEGVNMNILNINGSHPLKTHIIEMEQELLLIKKYLEIEENLNFWLDCNNEKLLASIKCDKIKILIQKKVDYALREHKNK